MKKTFFQSSAENIDELDEQQIIATQTSSSV